MLGFGSLVILEALTEQLSEPGSTVVRSSSLMSLKCIGEWWFIMLAGLCPAVFSALSSSSSLFYYFIFFIFIKSELIQLNKVL